jgi:hypothetical protein
VDVALVSASAVSLGWFAFLLIPYFICLAYARKRLEKQELRDELRKEVAERRGFD